MFQGVEPRVASTELYRYMREEGIPFPTPGTAESARLWKAGLDLAQRPGYCRSLDKQTVYEI